MEREIQKKKIGNPWESEEPYEHNPRNAYINTLSSIFDRTTQSWLDSLKVKNPNQ